MDFKELQKRGRAAAQEYGAVVSAVQDAILEEANKLFAQDSSLVGIAMSEHTDPYNDDGPSYWFGHQTAPSVFCDNDEVGITLADGHYEARALFAPVPSALLLDYFGHDGWALLVTRAGLTVFSYDGDAQPHIPPGSDADLIMNYVEDNRSRFR